MKLLTLLALFGLVTKVSADQPVHCLRQDIYGEWTFQISQTTEFVNLFEARDVCTHNLPNGVQIVTPDHKFQLAQADTLKVILKDNYEAESYLCQGAGKCDKAKSGGVIRGKWSTVYDQAMKVELESGQRFIANFRYNAKSALTADPLTDNALLFADVKSGDYQSFDSVCSSTMVGFVQTIGGNGILPL